MDVYDFDGTLYCGDSTVDFVCHCLKRYPRIIRTLPRTGIAAIACMGLRLIEKTQFKAALYRFLPLVPDVEFEVDCFWKTHESKIGGPCEPKPGDLVISASPEFLLQDVCEKRGLILMGSQVDPHTGRVLGPNCSGQQKITRLQQRYPNAHVKRFYSDSHDDDSLAAYADQAFLVDTRVQTLQTWPTS